MSLICSRAFSWERPFFPNCPRIWRKRSRDRRRRVRLFRSQQRAYRRWDGKSRQSILESLTLRWEASSRERLRPSLHFCRRSRFLLGISFLSRQKEVRTSQKRNARCFIQGVTLLTTMLWAFWMFPQSGRCRATWRGHRKRLFNRPRAIRPTAEWSVRYEFPAAWSILADSSARDYFRCQLTRKRNYRKIWCRPRSKSSGRNGSTRATSLLKMYTQCRWIKETTKIRLTLSPRHLWASTNLSICHATSESKIRTSQR